MKAQAEASKIPVVSLTTIQFYEVSLTALKFFSCAVCKRSDITVILPLYHIIHMDSRNTALQHPKYYYLTDPQNVSWNLESRKSIDTMAWKNIL